MGACVSTERRTQLLSGAVLAAAAAAVWCLTSNRGLAAVCSCLQLGEKKRGRAAVALDEPTTQQVMREMTEAFFCVFTELAQVARSVAQAVQNHSFQQGEAPTKEQVEAMLMEQVFRERLYNAEGDVLKRHNIEKEDLENACQKFRNKNEKVSLYFLGMKEMYEDAVNGELPLLPGAVLPTEASEDLIFALLQQVHVVKQEKFRHLLADAQLSDFKTPGPAMAKELQRCNKEAEQQVLSMPKYAVLTEALLLHAVALYSKSPAFKIKKQLLDEMHSEHLMAMMEKRKNRLQARGVYTPESDCVVAALHPKLEEVSAAELPSRLRSCEARGGAVAVLVLRSEGRGAAEAAAAAGPARGGQTAAASDPGGKRGREEGTAEEFAGSLGGASVKRGGVSYLRALNDFCEAVESVDDEKFSFFYLEHQEARQVPQAALKRAAVDAQNCGAAYLLFNGADAVKETTLLGEFIEAAEALKKVWQAERAATAAASAASASSSSSSSAAAAAEAASAAAEVPAGCPLRNEGNSPSVSASLTSTEALAADNSAAAAAVDEAGAAVDASASGGVAAATTAAAASPAQATTLACKVEDGSPCAAAAASAVLEAVDSSVFFASDVSTVGHHADAGDETLLAHVKFSGLGECAT